MSRRNANKALRRAERAEQKQAARQKINPGGTTVIVTREQVKAQRYLRDRGLPFSKSMAGVFIGR
jgi:hypothetical protein